MEKKQIWHYIQIGTDLRYIQDRTAGNTIIFKDGPRDNIRRLLENIEKLNLEVTLRGSRELQEFLDKLDQIEEERAFTKEEAVELKKIMDLVRHTMTAECQGVYAYITTEKRYDLSKLTDSIEKIFSPNVFYDLPDIAQYDLTEAGKCIVFERSTAAAFHILRATEVVLRSYYKKYLRKFPINKTWGQMLTDLKNKHSGKKPNPIILNHLGNIKDSFRNPTQHPDKIYDIQEVQDLLSVCIDVINKMIKEIKNYA
jgi:hypothetical protein